MTTKEKIEQTITLIIANIIVGVPLSIIASICWYGAMKTLNIDLEIGVLFLVWLLYGSHGTDEKIIALWRKPEQEETPEKKKRKPKRVSLEDMINNNEKLSTLGFLEWKDILEREDSDEM
jgi:hypothetical protein